MSRNTIIYGVSLIVVGLVGKYGTGTESWTALIPAIFGVIFTAAGIVGAIMPKQRKHIMHLCMAAGLFVLVALVAMLTMRARSELAPIAMLSQLIVIILTTVYMQLGVRSFIDARIKRDKE